MTKDLVDIVRERRSIREFNEKPVDLRLVREIVGIASHAPSNNNRQGWKFYVVSNRDLIDAMYRVVVAKVDAAGTKSEVLDEILQSYRANFTVFRGAPILIICCFTKPSWFSRKLGEIDEENSHMSGELISVSLVMQNILLLAESRGLGTLIMTAPLIAAGEIKDIVGIPRKLTIAAFICMGYYDDKPAAPSHLPVDQILEIL